MTLRLHHAPMACSLASRFALTEAGLPHEVAIVRTWKGEQKSEAYRRINPMGKVPALTDGDAVVSENPAICLYLADRYGYGTLAPKLEEPARGPYMSWTVWATAVLEPASALDGHDIPPKRPGAWHFGFGTLARELEVLREALEAGGDRWLLGERFTAADVMVGTVVGMRLFTGEGPREEWLVAYSQRCEARPAYKRAADLNWPRAEFAHVQPAP